MYPSSALDSGSISVEMVQPSDWKLVANFDSRKGHILFFLCSRSLGLERENSADLLLPVCEASRNCVQLFLDCCELLGGQE